MQLLSWATWSHVGLAVAPNPTRPSLAILPPALWRRGSPSSSRKTHRKCPKCPRTSQTSPHSNYRVPGPSSSLGQAATHSGRSAGGYSDPHLWVWGVLAPCYREWAMWSNWLNCPALTRLRPLVDGLRAMGNERMCGKHSARGTDSELCPWGLVLLKDSARLQPKCAAGFPGPPGTPSSARTPGTKEWAWPSDGPGPIPGGSLPLRGKTPVTRSQGSSFNQAGAPGDFYPGRTLQLWWGHSSQHNCPHAGVPSSTGCGVRERSGNLLIHLGAGQGL